MPFLQPDQVRYYTFECLSELGVTHAVFTRQGGISPAPWDSLNVGGTVGDDPTRVAENRRRTFEAVGRSPDTMFDVWQVHSVDVVCTDVPRPAVVQHAKADAMLTSNPGVTLYMRFADCVPIFLYDPERKVVGLVHAGWQGTVCKIAAAAVAAMQAAYQSQPEDVIAAIGPSIGAHHYQVGMEVVQQVHNTFGDAAIGLLPRENGAVKFDLWQANRLILEDAGVRFVESAEICTACHPDDWYSHRGDNGKTGRFGALIALSG